MIVNPLSGQIDFSSIVTKIDSISTKLDSLPSSGGNGGQVGVFAAKEIILTIPSNVANLRYDQLLSIGYFYAIECNVSCRIRGYSSIELLTADANRSVNIKPMASQNSFDLQIIKSDSNKNIFYLAPIAIFAGTSIFLNIDNLTNNQLNLSIKYVG